VSASITDAAKGVADLAARYRLSEKGKAQLLSLLELVATTPHAPTTLRDPGSILDDHIADSLVALELSVVRSAREIADIGAGAGFPGLPLAIVLPSSSVTLVDGSSRKIAFIETAIRACGIDNAWAVHARAEEWPDGLRAFDLVTARALAPVGVVAEYAAPLLRVGGSLLAWRGRLEPADEAAAGRAAAELGLEVAAAVSVRPYPAATNRHLQLMLKVRDTPSRFPRRPGVARKRPLGAN
jgi:16S rRNA (guanine527-N7)-methyltransferase